MVEKQYTSLLSQEGFIAQFYLFCGEYLNDQHKAYEATERMFESAFGKRKYSGWKCFQEIKNRNLRESKNNG
jgi:hypothetical protein